MPYYNHLNGNNPYYPINPPLNNLNIYIPSPCHCVPAHCNQAYLMQDNAIYLKSQDGVVVPFPQYFSKISSTIEALMTDFPESGTSNTPIPSPYPVSILNLFKGSIERLTSAARNEQGQKVDLTNITRHTIFINQLVQDDLGPYLIGQLKVAPAILGTLYLIANFYGVVPLLNAFAYLISLPIKGFNWQELLPPKTALGLPPITEKNLGPNLTSLNQLTESHGFGSFPDELLIRILKYVYFNQQAVRSIPARPVRELTFGDYIGLHGLPLVISNSLDFSHKYLTSLFGIKLLQNTHNVLNLNLGQNFILGPTLDLEFPYQPFAGFPNLTQLNLGSNALMQLRSDLFVGLEGILRLFLESNKISAIAPNSFAGLGRLVYLNLSNNWITEIALNSFAGLGKLIQLELANNQIASIAPNSFAGVGLRNLDLANNQIAAMDPNFFAGLENLMTLDLAYNKIIAIPPNFFAGLRNLIRLNLRNNCMPPQKITPKLKKDFGLLGSARVEFNPQRETCPIPIPMPGPIPINPVYEALGLPTNNPTPYEILGVAPDADIMTRRTAFHNLTHKWERELEEGNPIANAVLQVIENAYNQITG